MGGKTSRRLSPEDWLFAAIEQLDEHGVDGVNIVALAKKLGATSGSFYWHFKDRPELLAALLEHWELVLTDQIIDQSRASRGSPAERILDLMIQVIEHDAARLDHAIAIWAGRDGEVKSTFDRVFRKRLNHASWMFRQAGFNSRQARIRGRLMIAYLMGESSSLLKASGRWKAIIKDEFEVLLQPSVTDDAGTQSGGAGIRRRTAKQ